MVMLLFAPFPVPTTVSPQLVSYQVNIQPEPPGAESVIFPGSSAQKLFRSLEAVTGATGNTPMTCVAPNEVSLYALPRAGL